MENEAIIEKTKGVVYKELSASSMNVTTNREITLTDQRLILPVSDVSVGESLLGAVAPIYGIMKKVRKRVGEKNQLELNLEQIKNVGIAHLSYMFKKIPLVEITLENGKKLYFSVSKGWLVNEKDISDFAGKLKSAVKAVK